MTPDLAAVATQETEAQRLQQQVRAFQGALDSQADELRQARRELEEANARFRELYAAAPIGLILVGLQSRILSCNARATEILQLLPDTKTRRRFTDFLLGENIAKYEQARMELFRRGAPVTMQCEMRRSNGQTFWADVAMRLDREASDHSLVCRITLADASHQRRMQNDVARLAAIVTSADQAILSEDLDGIITSWNAGAERLFGYNSAEVAGHNIEMLAPADRQDEAREIRTSARRRASVVNESVRLHRDGRPVPILLATAPIFDGMGRVVGVSHILRDITEQVAGRKVVARLLGDLQDADRRKDDFIATLAHELRNPLAPIRNAAAVLRFLPDLDPKVQWCRDVIDRQVSHMATLLDDLLDVSRVTRNMIALRLQRVELGSAIAQAVETARPMISAKGHALVLEMPVEPIEVEGDLTRLTQIFGNLLTNAAKYTAPGGEIRVTVEARGLLVVITVRDNGIGIDSSNLERIFQLFSQVNPLHEGPDGGLGIGLALVRGLVSRHHGAIVATSEGLGKGSEFVVTLPVAAPVTGMDAPQAGSPPAPNGPAPSKRVLVVDDNLDAAESMAMMLKLHGYDVRTAINGEEGLALAASYHPHLMLLDLGLPGISGYEVARRVRQEPWGGGIALVACTGWGQEEDRRRTEVAGFDHHLVKPVNPDEVMLLLSSLEEAPQDA